MIVFLTSDLMMASNANAHAKQYSVAIAQVSSAAKAIEIIKANRPHLLLIDLQCPGLDIATLGDQLKKLSDSMAPLSIGYAQHVEVVKLQQARSAGINQVLTRGQVNSQMGQIIASAG